MRTVPPIPSCLAPALATMALALAFGACQNSPSPTTVAIQPFGGVGQAMVDTVKSAIGQAYGFRVVVYPRQPLPKSAFVNIKSQRYRADSLLQILKRGKPDTVAYVIGILAKDISTTKRDGRGNILAPKSRYTDWGVFGLGYRPGPSSVVSTYRIPRHGSPRFMARLKKICIHEIGHNLGLPHCTASKNCVMRDAAESIKTIDQVGMALCQRCQRLAR